MIKGNLPGWASLILVGPLLACAIVQQTPEPRPTLEQLAFEIQTATPTVSTLFDAPTATVDPNATATITPTLTATATQVITVTVEAPPTEEVITESSPPTVEPVQEAIPTQPSEGPPESPPESPPEPAPPAAPPAPVPVAEPLRGGEWDFEAGFVPWANPFGDSCDGSGLAIGWSAFTTRDQFGSSCMNQTTWADNVYSGGSAQEITFAFVGNEAGIFKSTETTPGHRYTIEAYIRREFSPSKVEVALGVDLTGGGDWQADTVQWFPWDDDAEDQWAKTEETVTATGESMTIFIKGFHPQPVGGGALRIDAISVVDLGPGQ